VSDAIRAPFIFLSTGILAQQLGYGKSHFSAALTELALNEAHIISIRINARNGIIYDFVLLVSCTATANQARKKSGALD
jgi:hypothetical protein